MPYLALTSLQTVAKAGSFHGRRNRVESQFISLSSKNLLPGVKKQSVVSFDTADSFLGT